MNVLETITNMAGGVISKGRSFRGGYTYSGEHIRKQRKKNGVGRPSAEQAYQMNKMHDAWYEKKFGSAE